MTGSDCMIAAFAGLGAGSFLASRASGGFAAVGILSGSGAALQATGTPRALNLGAVSRCKMIAFAECCLFMVEGSDLG